MNGKKFQTLLLVLYFFNGIGLITEFFLIKPTSLPGLYSESHAHNGEEVKLLGEISETELELSELIRFEDEITTYELKRDDGAIYIATPKKSEGFILLTGKFIALDEPNIPVFIYATSTRGAQNFEKTGISVEALVIITLYITLVSGALLFDQKKRLNSDLIIRNLNENSPP